MDIFCLQSLPHVLSARTRYGTPSMADDAIIWGVGLGSLGCISVKWPLYFDLQIISLYTYNMRDINSN